MMLGVCQEIRDYICLAKHLIELLKRGHLIELCTVVVGEIKSIAVEDISIPYLVIEVRHLGCIHRNKDIWHNTTATIDHTTCRGAVLLALVQVDRVLREEFMVVDAVHQVHTVCHLVAIGIWTLYRTTRRDIVASYGKTHSRAIAKWQLRLHKTLTKCAATNN